MLTLEQKAERRKGIGASDIGAILGVSRYRTGLDVWLDKTGRAPDLPDSEAALMGHLLEPVVAQRYQMLFPERQLTQGGTVWAGATDAPFFCTPDYYVNDRGNISLLEIKTRGYHTLRDWGTAGTDQVPPDVLAQVLWQQFITGYHADAEVALLVAGREFSLYRIGYEQDVVNKMIDFALKWWDRHIVKGEEPTVAGPNAVDYLRGKWTESNSEMLDATPVDEQWVEQLARAKQMATDADQLKAEASVRLMERIADNDGLLSPYGKVTWKFQKSRTIIDWETIAKKLGADLPANAELVQQHTVESRTRVFRFTPIKGDD
jgi:putative phage-type endonuclease